MFTQYNLIPRLQKYMTEKFDDFVRSIPQDELPLFQIMDPSKLLAKSVTASFRIEMNFLYQHDGGNTTGNSWVGKELKKLEVWGRLEIFFVEPSKSGWF